MSIEQELDRVRKEKFVKDMQSVHDKLNELCKEFADMPLVDFDEIMEEYNLHLDDNLQTDWSDEPPPWYYNEDFAEPW